MKIATWNVNSIKARLEIVCNYLRDDGPDVVLLQELKCETTAFPYLEIEDCGYNCAVFGQKTYNGVAILSKTPIENVQTGLVNASFQPEAARYIEGYVNGNVKVASIYVPNGESVTSEKFAYKMEFYQNLQKLMQQQLAKEEVFVLGGDFNVALQDIDLYDPAKFKNDRILYSDAERQALRRLVGLGFSDVYRQHYPHINGFSWWDYRAGRFDRDEGVRIDYLSASPQAADNITDTGVHRKPRSLEKPSDHTPVWCELAV